MKFVIYSDTTKQALRRFERSGRPPAGKAQARVYADLAELEAATEKLRAMLDAPVAKRRRPK